MTIDQRTGGGSDAALKAGMHRETAARYLEAQAGPQQLKTPHHWRTRQDRLEALWLQAKPWLKYHAACHCTVERLLSENLY